MSYANCGLPYHVGGKIEKESSLLGATEQTFREQFAIDVRTRCEVVGVSSERKTVDLKNHTTGEVTTEKYDKLVLSPGAAPIRPPLPGIDLPGIFSVRTVPDARNMRAWLDRDGTDQSGMHSYTGYQTVTKPKRAVVVGGGFIGLEMVENLVHRGLEVTLIERLAQVMPPLDPEMAILVERYMTKHGVRLELNDGVAEFRQTANGSLEVLTSSGKSHPADIVILAIGVRPETALAKMAGIEIGHDREQDSHAISRWLTSDELWCRPRDRTWAPTPNRTCKISKHPAFQSISISSHGHSACGTPDTVSEDSARRSPVRSWRSNELCRENVAALGRMLPQSIAGLRHPHLHMYQMRQHAACQIPKNQFRNQDNTP